MSWKLTYLLSPLFLLVVLFHTNAQNNFKKGVAAYHQKDYSLAVSEFQKVLTTDENNISAWYNLGLSNIGKKAYGEAILNFEKVLKHMPNDSESEAKIEYCFGELHPETEWTPLLNSIQSSLYSLPSNTWAFICVALSFVCALGIVLYVRQKKRSLKVAFLFMNLFFLGGFIASIVICINVNNYATNSSYAVVTLKSIPTFIENSPSPKTTIAEGIRVEVIEKMDDDFVEVRTLTREVHVVRSKELSFI
ncbi:MAG: hypothetical protein QNL61_07250 [Crocinitomicaceae bacterium]